MGIDPNVIGPSSIDISVGRRDYILRGLGAVVATMDDRPLSAEEYELMFQRGAGIPVLPPHVVKLETRMEQTNG